MKKPLIILLTGILVFSWLVLPLTGCDNACVEQNEQEHKDVFSVYLLAEKLEDEPPYDLTDLKLQEEPWLSIEDIDYYDFSTHYIYLKEDKTSLFGEELRNISDFVVIAKDEMLLGTFSSPVPFISAYEAVHQRLSRFRAIP